MDVGIKDGCISSLTSLCGVWFAALRRITSTRECSGGDRSGCHRFVLHCTALGVFFFNVIPSIRNGCRYWAMVVEVVLYGWLMQTRHDRNVLTTATSMVMSFTETRLCHGGRLPCLSSVIRWIWIPWWLYPGSNFRSSIVHDRLHGCSRDFLVEIPSILVVGCVMKSYFIDGKNGFFFMF